MSLSKRVLRRVQKSLNGTILCKDVLVLTPTEHILRGYCFERTTEREMFYLWQVVLPLYRPPVRHVVLDYSSRVPNRQNVRLAKDDIDNTSDEVLKIISDGLPYLRKLQRPKEFLEHVSWMIGNTSPRFRLDLALTHYMLGNIQICLKMFEEIAADAAGPPFNLSTWCNDVIIPLIDDLKIDSSKIAHRIEAWERQNVETLDLAEATILAAH